MSWFSDLIERIAGKDAIDFVVTPALPLGKNAPASVALGANQCYIELRVASLRIPKSRRFTSNLYGVVHAFTTLSRNGAKDVQFASVSAPDRLAGIDPGNAYNAIMVDKVVMGPVAWRGGNLDVEMGLFSVVSSDLAGPFIGLITDLATTAGVSFVAAATPFVPIIKKGVELLAGKVGDGSLEIGISRTIQGPMTGVYAIVGVDRNGFDQNGLSVDPADFKLVRNGAAITQAPYLVYQISMSQQRADFGNIPELAQAFQDLLAKIRDGKEDPARESLGVYRRLVLTSQDLIDDDATQLVAKATQIVDRVFKGGPTGKETFENLPASLAEIGLYQ
jgi:hypothetical protein